tara:strand:+ start:2785 stop:3648 length:864 start_codon:yes stop_codon:yes gene_type:complete
VNYVLVSIGTIPSYINKTINSILTVDKDAKIFLGSDQKTDFKNIETINLEDIVSEQTKKIKNNDIFKGTIYESNPLWSTSLLRIFYLRDIQKELNLEPLIHFDNDILIYKPYEELKEYFDFSKFNITPASKNRLIFGYSFIPNHDIFNKLCESLDNKIEEGIDKDWEFNNFSPPNEMDLMGMIYNKESSYFNFLPILPYDSSIIFDPLSYGMYIDGSHTNPRRFYSRRQVDFNDVIGVELYSKRIETKFVNSNPIVYWDDQTFEMSNLHIHSKRFDKFLPKGYKNYI